MSGEEWFASESPGIGPVLRYGSVTALIDADAYFSDLRKEVERTGSNGLVCWIGFEASGDTAMPASAPPEEKKAYSPRKEASTDKKWIEVLRQADTTGARIRALLNLHPSPAKNPQTKRADRYKGSNLDLVTRMNREFRNCLAINDFRYLWLNGTHHQKLVIVANSSGVMAYVGTNDVESYRITDRWCEVHLKVTGEPAKTLYTLFYNRWYEHVEVLKSEGAPNNYLPPPDSLSFKSPGGKYLMQVSTTYGNPRRRNPLAGLLGPSGAQTQVVNLPHRIDISIPGARPKGGSAFPEPQFPGLSQPQPATTVVLLGNDFFAERDSAAPVLLQQARRQNPTYSFAPDGHTGIYRQIEHAIAQTKSFIYMEDQYLVCDKAMGKLPSMLQLLEAKLKQESFRKLVIFTTRIDEINEEFQFTAWAHRYKFVSSLVAAGGDKVLVCQYRSNKDLGARKEANLAEKSPFYIHSKTWFFDDEYMIVGSANCNRRGYSHDSELDIGVYDTEKNWVKDVRARVWLRRLNTQDVPKPLVRADVIDFMAGCRYWESPQKYGLAIENHRVGVASLGPAVHKDKEPTPERVDEVVDIGHQMYPQVAGPESKLRAITSGLLWDIAVDPDGT